MSFTNEIGGVSYKYEPSCLSCEGEVQVFVSCLAEVEVLCCCKWRLYVSKYGKWKRVCREERESAGACVVYREGPGRLCSDMKRKVE